MQKFQPGDRVRSRSSGHVVTVSQCMRTTPHLLNRAGRSYDVDFQDGTRAVVAEWALEAVTDDMIAAQERKDAMIRAATEELQEREEQERADGGWDG